MSVRLRSLIGEPKISPVIRLSDLRSALKSLGVRGNIPSRPAGAIKTVSKGTNNIRSRVTKKPVYAWSVNKGLCQWCRVLKAENNMLRIAPLK